MRSLSTSTILLLFVLSINFYCTDVLNPFETKPVLQYADSLHAFVGEPIEFVPERKSGGDADSITIFPDLPAGLSLNTHDGTISGSPQRGANWRIFTIRAANKWGKEIDTVHLAISPPPPATVEAVVCDGGRMKVSWSAVMGAESYVVYRSSEDDSVYDSIGTFTDTLFYEIPGASGAYSYSVSAGLGDAPLSRKGTSTSIPFTIEPAAPVLSAIPAQSRSENEKFDPIRLSDYVSDIDTPDSLLVWNGRACTLLVQLSANSMLTVAVPDSEWNGTDTVMVTVTDPDSLSATFGIPYTLLAVNDAPHSTAPDSLEIREGEQFETIELDSWVEDVDNTDEQIRWSVDGNEFVEIVVNDKRQATVTTPDADWFGTDSALFVATDTLGASVGHWVHFIVHAVNDTPRIVGEPLGAVVQDSLYVYQFEAYDPEGDELLIELREGPVGMTLDTMHRRIEWSPLNSDVREDPYTVTIRVSETKGDNLGSQQSWRITVIDRNDYPHADDTTVTTDEDDTIDMDFTGRISDPDGDPLVIKMVSVEPSHGSATIIGDSMTVRYRPDADYAGEDSFSYTVYDGRGGMDEATVYITINGLPDAPVALPDMDYSVDEDQSLVIDVADGVLANDTDADNDVLTAVLTQPVDTGTLTFNANGSFVYQPPDNYFGQVAFFYLARDADGYESESVEVTITVRPVADPPRIEPVSEKRIFEGEVLTFDIIATDPDGTTPRITLDDLPGWASFDGKTFSGTPERADVGEHSFLFTATDGTMQDEMAVDVTVIRIVIPPVVTLGGLVAGRLYAEDEYLDLTATASDEDGSVDSVEFFRNDIKVGADNTSPYTFTTDAIGIGQYSFHAIAIDNEGNRKESEKVNIIGGAWRYSSLSADSALDISFKTDQNGNIYKTVVRQSIISVDVFEPLTQRFEAHGAVRGFQPEFYDAEIAFHPLSNKPYIAAASQVKDTSYNNNTRTIIRVYEYVNGVWWPFGDTLDYNEYGDSFGGFYDLEMEVLASDDIIVGCKRTGRYAHVYGELFAFSTTGNWDIVIEPDEPACPVGLFSNNAKIYLVTSEITPGPDGACLYNINTISSITPVIEPDEQFADYINGKWPHYAAQDNQLIICLPAYTSGEQNTFFKLAGYGGDWENPFVVDTRNDSANYVAKDILVGFYNNAPILSTILKIGTTDQHQVFFKKIVDNRQISFPYAEEIHPELTVNSVLESEWHAFFGDEAKGGPIAFIADRNSEGSPIIHVFTLDTGS